MHHRSTSWPGTDGRYSNGRPNRRIGCDATFPPGAKSVHPHTYIRSSRLSTQTRLLATNEAVRIANSEQSRSVNSIVSSAPSRVLRPSSRHPSTSSSSFPSVVHYHCFASSSYDMPPDMTFAPFVPSAAYTMSTLISASASMLATPKPPIRASGSGSTARCGASLPPTRRLLPVQHDLTTPRARARAARLRANEAAELHEDLAALITTPAQWALLRRSFAGVKTEFADLDGMSWHAPYAPPVAVSAPAAAAVPDTRRRPPSVRRSSSTYTSASTLDDGTVRPRLKKRKRRLSVTAPMWGQGVTSKTRS